MRLRPDLVLLPLDDDVVIFSEEAQCLIGLNASAAFVFGKLQEGMSASEIAGALASEGVAVPEEAVHWVATTLDAFGSHGVLAGAPAPTILSTGTPDEDEYIARLAAKMPPYTPFKPAAERRYRLLDTCAVIRFAMLEQVPWVDAVIGHLATDNGTPTMVMDIQGMTRDDRRVRSHIYRDGEPAGLATKLSRLGPAVKGLLWQSAVNTHDFLFYLHAGVVGTGETCVLLPAAAGSGKSSLTAALCHRGFRYFSDEIALIEPETFRVPPVPLALCFKSTGWDIVARYYPDITALPIHERGDGKLVRYLTPPSGAIASPQTSAQVSHIIFPRYSADGRTELKAVARSEALRRLMDECLALRLRLDLNKVAETVRWIAGIDCFEVSFSSLDKAAELVAQVLKRGLSARK